MMSTEDMLRALVLSENVNCSTLAKSILAGEKSIEEELKYVGSFMRAVLKGNYVDAISCADDYNKNAFINHQIKYML